MKTSLSLSRNVRNSIAMAIALFSASSFVASCTKDELQPVAAPAAAQSVVAKNPPAQFPYDILIIDHKAGGWGMGADYKVTMLSNGTGIFEGRKNVGTLKTVKFAIDREAFLYVRNMFESANFFEIKDVAYVPDAAETFTTYSDGVRKATKNDFGLGEPAVLIKLRQVAEKKLQVDRFIAGSTEKQNAPQQIEN